MRPWAHFAAEAGQVLVAAALAVYVGRKAGRWISDRLFGAWP